MNQKWAQSEKKIILTVDVVSSTSDVVVIVLGPTTPTQPIDDRRCYEGKVSSSKITSEPMRDIIKSIIILEKVQLLLILIPALYLV